MDEPRKLLLQDDEEEGADEKTEFEEDDELDPEDAEKIEDGEICANCGAEFEKEQGTPSACKTCWPKLDETERLGLTEANCETL